MDHQNKLHPDNIHLSGHCSGFILHVIRNCVIRLACLDVANVLVLYNYRLVSVFEAFEAFFCFCSEM